MAAQADLILLHRVHDKLSQSLEAVQRLEVSHAQQRLDWEGRVRESEKLAYSKQQDVLNQLREARNKVRSILRGRSRVRRRWGAKEEYMTVYLQW